jgi:hypothetical protein
MYNIYCSKLGLWLKVDASRRRNDPRKLNKVLMSMVRLRDKSCRLVDERVSSERLIPGSKSSSRRVWGQRPGQLT